MTRSKQCDWCVWLGRCAIHLVASNLRGQTSCMTMARTGSMVVCWQDGYQDVFGNAGWTSNCYKVGEIIKVAISPIKVLHE